MIKSKRSSWLFYGVIFSVIISIPSIFISKNPEIGWGQVFLSCILGITIATLIITFERLEKIAHIFLIIFLVIFITLLIPIFM